MSTFDGKALGEQLTFVVRDFVQRSVSRLADQSDQLSARIDRVEDRTRELIGEAINERLAHLETQRADDVRGLADTLIAKFTQATHV